MALDPKLARHYLDDPPYRYSRALYAGLGRLVAGGNSAAVPIALLAINWLAIGIGTAAFALLMARGRQSVWLALLYGLAPGLVLGVHRDLTEPLAYAFAILGVLALTSGRPHRLLVAGALFGLAGLARQTTLLFPLAYGAFLLFEQRDVATRRAAPRAPALSVGAFFALSLGPYVVWAFVLRAWLGAFPSGQAWLATPFGWLFEAPWSWARQPPEILGVVIPTLLWLAVVVHAIRRRALTPALACAGIAAVAFVVFAPAYSGYPGAGRAAVAVAIPALLATVSLPQLAAWARRAHWLAVACWFSLVPAVVLVDLLDVSGPGAG